MSLSIKDMEKLERNDEGSLVVRCKTNTGVGKVKKR